MLVRRSGRKKAVVPGDVARDDNVFRKAGKAIHKLQTQCEIDLVLHDYLPRAKA